MLIVRQYGTFGHNGDSNDILEEKRDYLMIITFF